MASEYFSTGPEILPGARTMNGDDVVTVGTADVIPFDDGTGPVENLTPDETRWADNDHDSRHALLRILHPGRAFIDLRALHPNKRLPITANVPSNDLVAVDEFAVRHSDRNVYFGVAPRLDERGR